MNFASYEFWQVLVLCFLASRVILAVADRFFPDTEPLIGKLCLLATALTLLGSESLLTLWAFLWVVLLGWVALLVLAGRARRPIKSVLCFLLLVLQISPLFYYKYWNFLFNEVLGLGLGIPSVLIPMGLSFYTFQTIGFWVDAGRGKTSVPKFIDYLNFSSFFPQIVAGPIEKGESLLPQIQDVRFRIHGEYLDQALRWIVLGLAYKMVLADNFGALAQKLHVNPANAWHVWSECLVFGLRIYFDFSGYSFIAVGLGLLLGVRLTMNFRAPYWARDLREFWRVWHITLGAWLRDYVYLPLGGRKVRRWALNILIVFVLSGIWHGAGWGFLVWGLLHGAGVVVCSLGGKWIRWNALSRLITFAYVTAAWLFFLERDPALLWQKSLSLFNPLSYGISDFLALKCVFAGPLDGLVLLLCLLLGALALALEGWGLHRGHDPYHYGRSLPAIGTMVLLIVLLAPLEESAFIYFNF